MGWRSFFADVSSSQPRIGRDGFVLAALVAGLQEAFNLYRLGVHTAPWLDYSATFGFVVVTLALNLFFVQRMARRRGSRAGWLRFVTGWTTLLMPAALGIGLAAPLFGRGTGGAVWWLLAGLLLTELGLAMLPGWPVAMLFLDWRAGPWRVFKACHGSRWAIFAAACITSSISRASPDLEKAQTTTGLLLRAVLDLGLTTFQLIWIPSIAVAAWHVAAANDPALNGEQVAD